MKNNKLLTRDESRGVGVDQKMAANRVRRWSLGGNGQHIDEEQGT